MSWSRGNSVGASSVPQAPGTDADHRPLLENARHASASSSETQTSISRYGAVDVAGAGRSSRRTSPEVRRQDSYLNRVPEENGAEEDEAVEDEEDIEWNLEERGLYPGSYRRVVAMYTFVPVTSLLLLGFLALAPQLFWKYKPDERRSHPPYFPFPLPEFILSASLWSLAYLLRTPIFTIVSALVERLSPVLATFLFNLTHVLTYNLFRLSSLPILRLRDAMASTRPTWHDPVFYRVWWLALGWASIDVAVSIWQSYGQLALYRGVMVPADRVGQVLAQSSSASLLSSSQEALPLSPCTDAGKGTVDDAIRAAVDQDLEQLVALKEREDLEEIYGLPIVKIPVFVACLLRVDSILLSTGVTLTLAAAYLHSELALSVPGLAGPSTTNRPFLVAFPLIMLLNLVLNLLHTPLILPRIGVHTTAYIGFLLGLGIFFTGLGLWGALA